MISKFSGKTYKIFLFLLGFVILIFSWLWFVDLFLENDDVYASAPQNTQWVEVGKNKIAYQYFPADTGKNVALIGGTTAWSGVWKNTIEDLKGEYNIYAIDLPPFGFSIVDEEYKYNLANQADLINGFLKKLNIQDVIFVAHSYGAGPSMEAVLRNQDNYKKFIIIDGAIHVDRESKQPIGFVKSFFSIPTFRYLISSIALHLPGFMEASLKYLVYDNSKVDDFWVGIYNQPLSIENQSQKIAKWFYDFGFENGTGLSSEGINYKDLAIPVVIIWGKEDTFTPLEQGLYLQKIIPKNNLIILDKVGHIPMIDDHEGFIKVLKQNLEWNGNT